MTKQEKEIAQKASKEQVIYANILVIGVWSGLALLFITYFIYVLGVFPAHVELTMLPGLWDKGVSEYLELTNSPQGWGWVHLLAKGDFLNYLGFSWLALMTIVCYMVLIKGYVEKKDWVFTSIAVLEILVLSLAASGLLGSGGH